MSGEGKGESMGEKVSAGLQSGHTTLTTNKQLGQANNFLSKGFETHLCGCMEDCGWCCFTCFCPCVVSGFNEARAANRACTPFDALCVSPFYTRQLLRSQHNMGFNECGDVCSYFCCSVCAIVQDTKEIARKKGDSPVYFDMSKIELNIMGRD